MSQPNFQKLAEMGRLPKEAKKKYAFQQIEIDRLEKLTKKQKIEIRKLKEALKERPVELVDKQAPSIEDVKKDENLADKYDEANEKLRKRASKELKKMENKTKRVNNTNTIIRG